MALARWRRREEWDPFRDLLDLQKEINRLFDFSFSRFPRHLLEEERFAPAVDLYEDGEQYVVEAELPGLKQDEIKVQIDQDLLTISGKRKREKELKDENFYRSERYFGKFVRRISLPEDGDVEKVKATYKDGVLKISIPKVQGGKSKKIDVKVE